MLLKYLAGNITNIYNILKRYFNISRICCNDTLLCYLIFMWPFVPDKKKLFSIKMFPKYFLLQIWIHISQKSWNIIVIHTWQMREKKYRIKFQDNFNETHIIMIYIDWFKNGLLILLFQDNNGIYSLVMTLKAYNSNNRKKSSTKIRDQV